MPWKETQTLCLRRWKASPPFQVLRILAATGVLDEASPEISIHDQVPETMTAPTIEGCIATSTLVYVDSVSYSKLEIMVKANWLYSSPFPKTSVLHLDSRGCAPDERHHRVRSQQDDTAFIKAGQKFNISRQTKVEDE